MNPAWLHSCLEMITGILTTRPASKLRGLGYGVVYTGKRLTEFGKAIKCVIKMSWENVIGLFIGLFFGITNLLIYCTVNFNLL